MQAPAYAPTSALLIVVVEDEGGGGGGDIGREERGSENCRPTGIHQIFVQPIPSRRRFYQPFAPPLHCRTVVQTFSATETTCPIEHCPGVKPGTTTSFAIVKDVMAAETSDTYDDSMILKLVEEMLKDGGRKKKRGEVKGAQGGLRRWHLPMLSSLAGVTVAFLACGIWLQAIVASR